ncbi:hypothetical protein [Fibrella aestuarina]|uniref:hypothetical protein n=1 Tax=Fibrella aestuarina TaxID=651143 RepID=UPI00059D29BA|nr:hypothetical protein [Fibrella aestuarina]
MGGTNANEQHMLDETLGTFRGDLSTVPDAQTGQNLIQGWLDALSGDANVEAVSTGLTQLQALLRSDEPDPAMIKDVLADLAAEAARHAEAPSAEGTWTGKLESLSKILQNLSAIL